MALATLGGVISMTMVALINWRFDRDFADEFRRSLEVKGKEPLGEFRLRELMAGDGEKAVGSSVDPDE